MPDIGATALFIVVLRSTIQHRFCRVCLHHLICLNSVRETANPFLEPGTGNCNANRTGVFRQGACFAFDSPTSVKNWHGPFQRFSGSVGTKASFDTQMGVVQVVSCCFAINGACRGQPLHCPQLPWNLKPAPLQVASFMGTSQQLA